MVKDHTDIVYVKNWGVIYDQRFFFEDILDDKMASFGVFDQIPANLTFFPKIYSDNDTLIFRRSKTPHTILKLVQQWLYLLGRLKLK